VRSLKKINVYNSEYRFIQVSAGQCDDVCP
jgi:hypothetical protein